MLTDRRLPAFLITESKDTTISMECSFSYELLRLAGNQFVTFLFKRKYGRCCVVIFLETNFLSSVAICGMVFLIIRAYSVSQL